MRKCEVETLAKAIAAANQQHGDYPENELSAFLSMEGDLYSGKLMIVGRAVNGWRTTWKPDTQPPVDALSLSEKTLKNVTSSDRCPMLWVTDKWNGRKSSSDNYKTRTSAFWRVTKKIVKRLNISDVNQDNWPSFLVWSNLYKLSHCKKGNPSDRLQKIQFDTCAELLLTELQTYKPEKVLMLTGLNWAKPFLNKLGISWRKTDISTYVEGVAEFNRTKIVISQHPQGKKEKLLVEEVVSNIS